MQRIPEPELMNDREQAEAYAAADFTEPNQLFLELFARCFPAFAGRQAVDLGCGPGAIPVAFARAYPGCRVLAIDGAETMLELARSVIAQAGLTARVQLQRMRIGAPPTGAGAAAAMADAVISNSLLHHLDDPDALWATVREFARPGAAILVMDLVRPASRDAARALVAEYASDEAPILQRDFFNSLLAAYRLDEVRDQLKHAGLDHLSVETVSDRHLAVHGTLGSAAA